MNSRESVCIMDSQFVRLTKRDQSVSTLGQWPPLPIYSKTESNRFLYGSLEDSCGTLCTIAQLCPTFTCSVPETVVQEFELLFKCSLLLCPKVYILTGPLVPNYLLAKIGIRKLGRDYYYYYPWQTSNCLTLCRLFKVRFFSRSLDWRM